ncbi:hypothetical protein IW261DRAFT_1426010 [Armillaria novae-zelandiae]|uniref:Uncharacterized protein n=1 Tax=Armillaria novae-zelandiae TaxID=153914 RepID=A0AA39NNN0_9AGAR|nr:hypothetical protein IW261DRAFT_1426010 [Armillaria novae-zelandiae]
MQRISKLEELLKELEVENTRKSLEIGMHYHLKTVAVEERDSVATRLNDAQDELKSVGWRLEEATVALLNMQTTSRFHAEEREQLLVRLNNGEAQLRATEQRLGDTEARMLNMASLADSRMTEFQQEKDYLVNEVIKFTQKEKELLAVRPSSLRALRTALDLIANRKMYNGNKNMHDYVKSIKVHPAEIQKLKDCHRQYSPKSAVMHGVQTPILQKPSVDRSLIEVIHALLKTVELTKILDQISDVNLEGETRKVQLQLDDHFRRYP